MVIKYILLLSDPFLLALILDFYFPLQKSWTFKARVHQNAFGGWTRCGSSLHSLSTPNQLGKATPSSFLNGQILGWKTPRRPPVYTEAVYFEVSLAWAGMWNVKYVSPLFFYCVCSIGNSRTTLVVFVIMPRNSVLSLSCSGLVVSTCQVIG